MVMDTALSFTHEMLMLYLIALVGFMLRKKGILHEQADSVFTQLILYVTLPALILFSLNIPFSVSLIKEFLWLIAMSIYVLTLAVFLAMWLRRRCRLPDKQRTVYESLMVFGNQGFIGYAVSYALFDEPGIVYVTIFNVCYLLLIWTYGIYLYTKNRDGFHWRTIYLNPGTVATVIGVLMMVLPFQWPPAVSNGLESVGKMTLPLSMLMIGSLMAKVSLKELKSLVKNHYLWRSAVAKLILMPSLLLPFALFPISFPVLAIAVIVSGMPSAPTMSIYAEKYGSDATFASSGVLLTTLLCIGTIPFLYWLVSTIYYF